MKHTFLLFLLFFACATVARDTGWELLRCEWGTEVCFLHHQILPTDDRWTMTCLIDKDAKWSGTKTALPTTFHGR